MSQERVLIVDDSTEIRRVLARLCARDGCEVVTAPDGETALELLRDDRFDVAVVDLIMPGIDGVAVLREIREKSPWTDVIILTGYGELETAATTLHLGASYYLQKESFNLNLIPLVIRRIIERQRLAGANDALIQELREANQDLAESREQQLQSIQHIGRALAGGLHLPDMMSVLVQALESVVACDAAGLLVLAQELTDHPVVLISGEAPLASSDEATLIAALKAAVEDPILPEPESLRTSATEPGADSLAHGWGAYEIHPLVARGTMLGVAVIARHAAQPFSHREKELLRTLCTQGSIALENTYLFARMVDLATRDSLTGLYNHGHFYHLLDAELARSERQGHSLAVIMLDMDKDPLGLKAVNDTYGHQAGDALLVEIADRLRSNLRRADAVARYGGDEFVVLAPETGPHQAEALARRLWATIRDVPFLINDMETRLTASLGVAVSSGDNGHTPEYVVKLADQACYEAKELGRDRVCLAWE